MLQAILAVAAALLAVLFALTCTEMHITVRHFLLPLPCTCFLCSSCDWMQISSAIADGYSHGEDGIVQVPRRIGAGPSRHHTSAASRLPPRSVAWQ